MNTQSAILDKPITPEALNELIIDSIQDIKGKNIQKLDMGKLPDAPTDFFIVCEGDSNTQVKAIADNIQKRLKYEAGQYASHVEGEKAAQWICLDYFTVAIHVFHKTAREFYQLEELWSDAKITEYATL
ncbi:MAG: ribosome silencing factor [Saprospiraceae bacterium]